MILETALVKVELSASGFTWSFNDPNISEDDEQEIIHNVNIGCLIEAHILAHEVDPNEGNIVHMRVTL